MREAGSGASFPARVASCRGEASARSWIGPDQPPLFNRASALGDLQVGLSSLFGGEIFSEAWCLFGTLCVAKGGGAERRDDRLP